ncbi:MAG TPA: septum formation family protein [Microbacterium sp.]|nr:septum formation family protein [Microbacterium sp.]
MMKLRTRRAMALAGSAVALSIALTGCSTISNLISGDAPRDEETDQVTEEAEIDIFQLKVGDCLTEEAMTGGETNTAPVIPCDEPHPYEVYYEFELEDGEFPGSAAIEAPAIEKCEAAFTEFVGLTWDESTLEYSWFEPTQASWDQGGDRLLQCIIYDPADDALTGSLKGAAR